MVVCELGVSCVSHFSRCCGRFIERQLWLVAFMPSGSNGNG